MGSGSVSIFSETSLAMSKMRQFCFEQDVTLVNDLNGGISVMGGAGERLYLEERWIFERNLDLPHHVDALLAFLRIGLDVARKHPHLRRAL